MEIAMVHLQPSFLMRIGGRNMDDKMSAAYRTLREATPRPSSELRLLCRDKSSDCDKFYHRYILLRCTEWLQAEIDTASQAGSYCLISPKQPDNGFEIFLKMIDHL